MKRKITGIILALVMLLTLGLAACDPVEPVAPGAAPAIFGNLKIDNTFISVWNSSQAYIRMTFPATADTLVGRDTTDTLTNKTLTSPTVSSPTITGTSVVSNRASGNVSLTNSGSVIVTHGMSGTPTRIFLQTQGILGTASSSTDYNDVYWDVGATTNATNFTITSMVASNATKTITWLALIADE